MLLGGKTSAEMEIVPKQIICVGECYSSNNAKLNCSIKSWNLSSKPNNAKRNCSSKSGNLSSKSGNLNN
jgi:hypothetical protein